jgi:hypothetical protein
MDRQSKWCLQAIHFIAQNVLHVSAYFKAMIKQRHETKSDSKHLYNSQYYIFQPVPDGGFINKAKHLARFKLYKYSPVT